MDFWSQYWAIFLGITSAMVTLEVGMVGLHHLMGRSQKRKMKEIQDRMESGDLTDEDMDVIGASMPGIDPSYLSKLTDAMGPSADQPKTPASGTEGGLGQYL